MDIIERFARLQAENQLLAADADFHKKNGREIADYNGRLEGRIAKLEAELKMEEQSYEILADDNEALLARNTALKKVVDALMVCREGQKSYEPIDSVGGWQHVERAIAGLKNELKKEVRTNET